MREDNKQQSAETDAQKQHQHDTFLIRVRNKFDVDPRRIKVIHKDKDKKDKKKDTLFHIVKNQPVQQGKKNAEKYELLPKEFLVIEPAEEERDFREFEHDVYIGLPFIADYEFSWEKKEKHGEEVIKKQVDRPMTSLRKDTRPDSEQQTEMGRAVIRIPGDQRAWKLEIRIPGNLAEIYHTENLNTENLAMHQGDPDDVTVSDNG